MLWDLLRPMSPELRMARLLAVAMNLKHVAGAPRAVLHGGYPAVSALDLQRNCQDMCI